MKGSHLLLCAPKSLFMRPQQVSNHAEYEQYQLEIMFVKTLNLPSFEPLSQLFPCKEGARDGRVLVLIKFIP